MTKFLIYIVAAAILVLLGVDTFFVATGKGTPTTIVELAVGGGAILAFAIAAFVRTIGGFSWPSWHRSRKVTIDEVDSKVDDIDDKVDTLDSKVDDIDDKVDTLDSKVDGISETLDGRLGPEPAGFVAVINTTDDDGKIVKLYDLPVSDTYEDAIQAARESLQARIDEGNPVTEAKITVMPVYEL
ncbi:MAG: hypothetical protein IKA48_01040 [Fibrobacter sp.]|nr:hypothetical protein [Fibrobacter sp.]